MIHRTESKYIMDNIKLCSIFGIFLLLSQFLVMNAYASADNDWVVELRQSPGTKACVEGGWTRDGERIDHPGGFYTICCEGTEKRKIISKSDIRIEPNDADYDIRIWWPGQTEPERHEEEVIPAPGSREYTNTNSSHENISVMFLVYPVNDTIMTVGGTYVPIDRISVLLPYISMALMISIIAWLYIIRFKIIRQ